MSKYVLVEFEDNEAADKLVAQITKRADDGATFRIAGVYQRPNAWCGCPFQIAGETRPVARGKKFGWWICQWCKKPRPGTHQLESISSDTRPINDRKYQYGVGILSIAEVPNPRHKDII